MKNLAFSFIIPAHNEEDIIEKCIDSIQKEKEKNYEIIVVNDGSKDKTSEIAKKKGVKVLDFKTGHSAAFARNRGAENAKGDYFIFIDADQTVEKNLLEKLKKIIKKDKFHVGAIRILSTEPGSLLQKGWHAYREYNKCATPIITKELFNKIKYNENLFYVEDDVIFEDARNQGYKVKETNCWVYHIDPKTISENLKQRKWQGRGLVIKIFKLKKYWSFKYFAPLLIIPLMVFWIYIPLIYFLTAWIFFSLKSKELINSFIWIIMDFIGRAVSFFWFLVYSIATVIKGKSI